MGKKQHSKDRMYLTATEWKERGGYKGAASAGDFPRLALDCCSLSFLPFTHPVCTVEGHIFELENIVPFVRKFHRNPVTDSPLELGQLVRLNFARNEAGALHCPVLFKTFSENTHVVAIKSTGNVYSYEAVDTLCLKPKSMLDLLDNTPFTRGDIITLQDPHNILARNPSNFAHIKDEKIAKQVDGIRNGETEASAASSSSSSSADAAAPAAAAAATPAAAAAAPAPAAAAPRGRPKLGISLAPKPSGAAAAAASLSSGPARAMYSSGAVSGSFTSTAMSVSTQNERALLSAEQILEQRYAHLRAKKSKGYVRLHTTLGNINLELHVDMVPRTCHNFLELCERGYYKDTKFHRVIPGFMVQGGDPDGTGRGGEGAFEKEFRDEFDIRLRHDARGILSMANSGPNTNGSQFFLTFDACSHLDNKHSVFGRVVGGSEVLDLIEKVETVKGKNEAKPKDCPRKDIVITAVTVYTNPFKEDFVPVDELTRKKEGAVSEEAAAEAARLAEGEMGAWFSNPTAEGLKPLSGDDKFKYLNLPKPVQGSGDATKQPALASKRKGSPNAATDEANQAGHPALRAAAAAASSASAASASGEATPGSRMDTSMTPKAGSGSGGADELDPDAAAFEAARRKKAQQQAAAAQQQTSSASSSYGNFSNW